MPSAKPRSKYPMSPLMRKSWVGLACYLAAGPLLAPLPLPWAPGGTVKMLSCFFAGPLALTHMGALAAYTYADRRGLLTKAELVLPSKLSKAAAVASLITLLTGTPAMLRLPGDLRATFGSKSAPQRPVWSPLRWCDTTSARSTIA